MKVPSPSTTADPVYNEPSTTGTPQGATPEMPVQASPTEEPAPTDPPMWQMIDPRFKTSSVDPEGTLPTYGYASDYKKYLE